MNLNLLRCLFYSVLQVHPHCVTRLTTCNISTSLLVYRRHWHSFAANVIQLASPVSGDGSEVNSYWSYTRPFFPTQYTEKSGLATRDCIYLAIATTVLQYYCYHIPVKLLK